MHSQECETRSKHLRTKDRQTPTRTTCFDRKERTMKSLIASITKLLSLDLTPVTGDEATYLMDDMTTRIEGLQWGYC